MAYTELTQYEEHFHLKYIHQLINYSNSRRRDNSLEQLLPQRFKKPQVTMSNPATDNGKDTTTAVSASTFLENIYPGRGQRNLKRILRQNPNIPTFQRSYSLHAMYAQAFQTNTSFKKNDSTRAAKKQKIQEQKEGVMVEPFQPDSVLQFLSHLGVSSTNVHIKIEEVLRSKLEEEIEKIDLRKKNGFDALSKLLIQAWEARDVPELRPVLVTVIKKMGEKTPTQLLQRLADREEDGSLKYAELFAQFGLPMKRLVWEADWEKGFSNALEENNNEGSTGIKSDAPTSSLLSDLLNGHIKEYCDDEDLVRVAEISFVGSIAERRILTQQRRTITSNASTTLPTSNILGKKDDRSSTTMIFSTSAEAISKMKEIIGDRPNLLAAVFHLLIHKHGKNTKLSTTSGNKILGGKQYLPCTLVGDILLSFGPLPKQYEFLGILATILDDSVRVGILSDDAIAQIQGCLRSIFAQASPNTDPKKKSESSPSVSTTPGNPSPTTANTATISTAVSTKPKKYSLKEDKTYVSSLLQEVIHSAIEAMKETDAKLVFLNPVTDAIAPGYSKVISKPMCILTISQKNNSRSYHSLQDFEKDVELMFQNCIKYNVGPDGIWFRGEAKRQRDIFKKNTGILSQAKGFWKKEIAERKKLMEKDYEKTWMEEKKKVREENAKLKKTKLLSEEYKVGISSVNQSSKSDLAITRLSAGDISPLEPIKIKKKRKDPSASSSTAIHIGSNSNNNSNDSSLDPPSIPALATMMLSDPFVVRLFLEKIFRTIRVQVLKEKSVFLPSCHVAIPSLFQMLHIAQGSSQLCFMKGRKYTVPDVGLSREPQSASNSASITINIKQEKEENIHYSTLRVYAPRYAELLLSLHLDERLSIRGDLHPVLSSPTGALSPFPPTLPQDWTNTTSLLALRSLVQYALVHIFAGNSSGRNPEKLALSLQTQLPRLQIVLSELSGGNLKGERPFWRSLVGGILSWKRKLGVQVRDLMVDFWLNWFKIQKMENGEDEEGCLCDPIHEMFLYLLNEVSTEFIRNEIGITAMIFLIIEHNNNKCSSTIILWKQWALLGNLILPRDKLLSLSTSAVKNAEPNRSSSDSIRPFASAWFEDSEDFKPIKIQYEAMLKNLGGNHADQWKESMNIDNNSFEQFRNSKRKEP